MVLQKNTLIIPVNMTSKKVKAKIKIKLENQ